MISLAAYRRAVAEAPLTRRIGRISGLGGLCAQVAGLDASVGELCTIVPARRGAEPVQAEVVGVGSDGVRVMPYGSLQGLAAGCEVVSNGAHPTIAVGTALLGRVIDAFGAPLDGGPRPVLTQHVPLRHAAVNPMTRPRIVDMLETGIRPIDSLLTIGRGQRVGIFAGSGVGKSTLLGMIARHVKADANVIALVGERGREVREFIEEHLRPQGLRRSVVVVAASDQPPLLRLRAAHVALAVAGHFRDGGMQVLLTMDSITRFAMARREVGLAAGEPPTARGYTPSVFAELPQLCERCGTADNGGSITALMTVLVEGDDFNEPISDCMRALLDGHIVLSRQLAHDGQYPAIDVLQSSSRLMRDVTAPAHRELAREAVKCLALLSRHQQMVDIGAYEHGSNPALDLALARRPRLLEWLRQAEGGAAAPAALAALADILAGAVTAPRGGGGSAP